VVEFPFEKIPAHWRMGLIGLLLGCGALHAMEIRGYQASRHDRFLDFLTTPSWNDNAWFGSRDFTGVGWMPSEPNRQFALVSPKHVVFATHYVPPNGTVIRFLNASGITVDRTVAGAANVLNGSGVATDLSLITLSSPIESSDGIVPFPYLNLETDAAYQGVILNVFGWYGKVGRGSVASIEDYSEPGVGETRIVSFLYPKASGNQDDGYLVVGDSGSPTFAMAGDVPALVGTHTAAGETDSDRINVDTFIPFYVTELNELLAPDGYQMTPAYPMPVTLSLAGETTPMILRQAEAGSCRFDLQNTSGHAAGNVTLTLRFPSDKDPDSLVAPGWIANQSGPGVWELHRANLGAGVTSSITASWLKLPSQPSLAVELIHGSDESPQRMQRFDLEPAPSYAAWSDGLIEANPADDSDHDGVINLLEYAFGGDPQVASMHSPQGIPLAPTISIEGVQAVLRFPIRSDAMLRGLTYEAEYSTTLQSGSWSSDPPPGMVVTDAPFDPPWSGFLRRTVKFSASASRIFCRVRIGLDEPDE
jgi:hypothetical protein